MAPRSKTCQLSIEDVVNFLMNESREVGLGNVLRWEVFSLPPRANTLQRLLHTSLSFWKPDTEPM